MGTEGWVGVRATKEVVEEEETEEVAVVPEETVNVKD